MVVTFCVSFVAAFLISLALVRRQRPPREPFALAQFALGFGAVIAVTVLMAALDVVSPDAAAAGAGCGLGILGGRWLAVVRAQSPG